MRPLRVIVKCIRGVAVVMCAALCLGCGGSDPSCPTQVRTIDGVRIPDFGHGHSQLSPDGTKLLYIAENSALLRVLDLRDGTRQVVDVAGKLPSNVRLIGIGRALWCPYDGNRLLVHCSTFTDTAGTGKPITYGQNLYIMSLDGSEFRRITPGKYGAAGSEHGLDPDKWLYGSRAGVDSIYGFYYPTGPDYGGDSLTSAVYIPQRDTLLPTSYRGAIAQTRDGEEVVALSPDEITKSIGLKLNGHYLSLPDTIELFEKLSWSPSGKLAALSLTPAHGYPQVWILDIDRYQREHLSTVPVRKIDFQQSFCTYSMWGIWAEFLSDSTLAVSMHKDGAEASYLWEITVDGDIVRQLTFQL